MTGIGASSGPTRFGVGSATVRDVLLVVLGADEPMSRKQVGDRLGLSSATITKAVAFLIDAGYLQQDAMRHADRPGRREAPLSVNPGRCHFLGVSIQDTGRLCGVLVDLCGEIVSTGEEVFGDSAVDDVVKAVNQLVEHLAGGSFGTLRGLGVAVGGQIDASDGIVRTSWNFDPPWHDVALARRLARATGLHVVIENDADALVAFEQRFGPGRDRKNLVVARITEVGVGFGIVAHGVRLHGEDGLNGELGHAEMDPSPDATKCRCGSTGCLEAFIAVAMRSRSWKNRRKARQVVREAGDAMGRVLAQLQLTNASGRLIVAAEDDNVIHDPLFQEAAHAAFERRPFMLPAKRVIAWERVSEADVARGAASLLFQDLSFDDR